MTRRGQRNEAMSRKKMNMKTKILVLGVVVTSFAFASFAGTGAAGLRPTASSNPVIPAAPATTVAHVNSAAAISPRALGNQSTVIKGTAASSNSALACRRNMVDSPKAVAECASHANMPACAAIAMRQ